MENGLEKDDISDSDFSLNNKDDNKLKNNQIENFNLLKKII